MGILLKESEAMELAVIQQFIEKKLSVEEACRRLKLHRSSLFRKVKRVRSEGACGLAHRLRGHQANNRKPEWLRAAICGLYAEEYKPHGYAPLHFFQHASDKFPEQVSYQSVWRWLTEASLVDEDIQRKRKHRSRRLRKGAFGEMLQMDTSIHDWLGWGNNLALVSTMDDATSVLCGALLTEKDTTVANLSVLKEAFIAYGVPNSIYVDRSPIFRVTRTGYGKVLPPKFKSDYVTHVQKALTVLKVELIFAYTPQAKGRVERSFRTWQSRLIPELRKNGIQEIAQANAYIHEVFMPEFNARFAKKPSELPSKFVRIPEESLDRALCQRYSLKVPNDHVLLSKGIGISLRILPSPTRISYAKARVDILKHPDGRVSVWHEDVELKTKPFAA
jgi:hypothetical protein